MKKNLLYTLLFGLTVLVGCGGDDEPAPHQVGTWLLDSYILTGTPSAYSLNDGLVYTINQIRFGNTVYESYKLELLKNGTYTRKIEVPGPSINDSGTWTIDDEDFILESDDVTEDYTLERNETDQLWISEPRNFLLLPNNILDTLTNAYVATLTEQEFVDLHDEVTIDFIYAFERETD